MCRKFTTIFIAFACVASLSACVKNGEDSAAGANSEAPILSVPELRTAIEEILTNASKGSGNVMAEIGGFSDKLDAIKSECDAIKDKSDGIYKKIASGDTEVVENLVEIWKALDEKMSAVKAAKSEKNIEKLKPALDALLDEIKTYGAYLDTVENKKEGIM